MIKVKNLVLGLGIIIVFALALWQGIEAFYPSPQYEKFCNNTNYGPYPTKAIPSSPEFQQNCTFSRELQQQQDQCYQQGGQPIFEYDNSGCTISIKNCDMCNKEFQSSQDSHAKYVFIVSIIVALITLIVGYSILSIEPVGSALIGSAIWAIFYGSVVNWRNFSDIWRFLLLFIALVLLIFLAVKLNKEKKQGFISKIIKK